MKKKRSENSNGRVNEKKKESKNCTQAWRELKHAYAKKNDLSLKLNKAVLHVEAF